MQLGALVLPASKSFCWNGLILYRYLLSIQSAQLLWSALFPANSAVVLGAGLEPACLSAYAPQTYVSAIPPPEQFWKLEDGRWETQSRKRFCRAKSLSSKRS